MMVKKNFHGSKWNHFPTRVDSGGILETDEIFPTFTVQVVLKQNVPLMCLLVHNMSILNFLFLQCSWSRPRAKNVFLWLPRVEPSHLFWNISSGWMKFNVDFLKVQSWLTLSNWLIWELQIRTAVFTLHVMTLVWDVTGSLETCVETTPFRNCSQTTVDWVKNKWRHLGLTR